MKFLCDQCKAKYQISDDKVAGKTVRMKCRKCGHQIEVRAAVTETSVSSSLPQSDAPPGAIASVRPSAPPGGAPPRPQIGGPRPGGLATSLSAARPAAPRASVHPPGGGGHAQGGALAGAFKTSVREGDDSAVAKELLELSSTDEWYCAINGVPVGPIRMTELRRKAALGAVTEDSLVWQEGLEEWRIAKTIPELTAIIREAQATGRPSLVTPQPSDVGGRVSSPPAAPSPSMRPGTMRSSPAVPRAPEPPRPHSHATAAQANPLTQASAARNNVVPINSRLATAERLDEAHAPAETSLERLSIASDPFASPPAAATASATTAGLGAGTSLSFPPPSPALPAAVALPAPIESRRASSPPPWILIAMLVLAAAFGVTAAIAIFFRPQPAAAPPPAPVVIQMPAPTPTQTAAATAPTPADSSSAAAVGSNGKPGISGKPGAIAAGAKPAGAGAKGVDPSVAALLQGAGTGPSTGGGGGGGGGGGSLTADQVEGVVRNHSLGVRRSCWERGASSSPSANITVTVSVGGTGNVTNATATGNDPAVAKCIEGAVRAWQFPPTGGSTTVNIPFHFVRQ